jgi:TPR repeat protein
MERAEEHRGSGYAEPYLRAVQRSKLPWSEPIEAFERLKLKVMLESRLEGKAVLSSEEVLILIYFSLLDKDERISPNLRSSLEGLLGKGDPRAFYLLGVLEERGVSPYRKNLRKAFNAYQKAARGEIQKAYLPLGEDYLLGIGTEAKPALAYSYFLQSEDSLKRTRYLGYLTFYGLGTEEDRKRGLSLLEEASALGDGEASFELGKIYRKGKEVPANPEKAFSCFVLAAEGDNPRACEEVGEMAYEGKGTGRDDLMALAYFRKGKKDPRCERRAADLLLAIYGRSRKEEARRLYEDSYAQGEIAAGIPYGKLLLREDSLEEKEKGYALLKRCAKIDRSLYFFLFENYRKEGKAKAARHYLKASILAHDLRGIEEGLAMSSLRSFARKALETAKENGEPEILRFLKKEKEKEDIKAQSLAELASL